MNIRTKKQREMFHVIIVQCILISLFSLTFHPVYFASSNPGGWELLQSGTTNHLQGVSFCKRYTCWVGGENIMLYTMDGGFSWKEKEFHPPFNIIDVSFFNSSLGTACGYSGTLIFTRNSGQDWRQVPLPPGITLIDVQMLTPTIAYAVGQIEMLVPLIIYTTDGWDTWQTHSFYIENDNQSFHAALAGVHFFNVSTGVAVARVYIGHFQAGGAIVRTDDGGETWNTVYWDSSRRLNKIAFPSQDVGYAVGEGGLLVKSSDGGFHWNEMSCDVTNRLNDVFFSSPETGYIVGDSGIILKTMNSGLSWIQQNSGISYDLYAIHFLTKKAGFVVGEDGVILRTMTGGDPFLYNTECSSNPDRD